MNNNENLNNFPTNNMNNPYPEQPQVGNNNIYQTPQQVMPTNMNQNNNMNMPTDTNTMNVNNNVPNTNINNNQPPVNNVAMTQVPEQVQTDNQENTMLSSMNVDGAYNGIQAPEYVNDTVVRENIEGQKKKTIPITKELKTVIVIALVLLIFIIIMPIFLDLLNKIRFH